MQYLKRVGLDLLKGAAAALSSFVGMMAGSSSTSLLGLPKLVVPAYMNMSIVLPLMFLSDILIAIVLGECFQGLYHRYWQRLLAIWVCNYLLYNLLNTLDAMLFMAATNWSTSIVSAFFHALFSALVIAWLWRTDTGSQISSATGQSPVLARKPLDLAWRLALAWLAYPPIYYLMGLLVAPFTQHYYEDLSLNLGLTMPPSVGILLAMQVLRGVLFLLAVLPIIITWRGSRSGLWLWMGTIIFIQIAIQAILQAHWLPLAVRIPHGLELLADSFLQAGVYALLLFFPSKPMAKSVADMGSD